MYGPFLGQVPHQEKIAMRGAVPAIDATLSCISDVAETLALPDANPARGPNVPGTEVVYSGFPWKKPAP